MSTCQADYVRIPNAHGTLVATDEHPADEFLPGLLAVSDVMGTGWYAAGAAEVTPGSTAVVVGDGAVGLCGVIAAKELGAERIIAMSRHEPRQNLAREFGATDIVAERGDEGIARVKDLTGGIGADSVLECVGTAEAMRQALQSAVPAATSASSASPTRWPSTGRSCSSPTSACAAAPPPCAATCPTSSTAS